MPHEPIFTPIDPAAWKRVQIFHYFSRMAPTGYSLTVQLDVTNMKASVKRAGMKFFPAYLWLVTRTLNRQEEFRMAEKDGQLGWYDHLTPLYASFHEDDKTFSLMWTAYEEDFRAFHAAYLRNQQAYGENHGILSQPDQLPPPNAYTVSCAPWIPFTHFAVHSYGKQPYYFPSVEAGRITLTSGRLLMPLSITCHHAATDGYHVARFLEELQADADCFDAFLS